jgi:hypothetical protein
VRPTAIQIVSARIGCATRSRRVACIKGSLASWVLQVFLPYGTCARRLKWLTLAMGVNL